MMNRVSLLIAVLALGCGDDANAPIDAAVDAAVDAAIDAPPGPDPRRVVAEVPATPNRNLDLLFVIDDSPSMADKQNNLANNFPNFISVLASVPGGLPNLHLGVVTTDMGTKGSEVVAPGPAIGQIGNGGCAATGDSGNLQINGAPVTGTFLSDVAGSGSTRVTNYTGTLAAAFSTMARVGAGGCGFEQPLAAMRAALDSNAANAGFLRADAVLGVVFLTDEDDCSIRTPTMFGPESAALGPLQSFRCTRFGVTCATGGNTSDEMNTVGTKGQCTGNAASQYITDVTPYRTFLHTLKGDTRKVVVAGIMGTTAPFGVELRSPPGGGTPMSALAHSCTYNGANGLEVADPPARIQAFLDQFPDHSSTSTICQQDLSGGLASVATLLSRAIGSPCLGVTLADSDPVAAGSQPDCIVEDIDGASVTPISACGASGPATCWRLVPNPTTCTLADHLELVVTRSGPPSASTVTRMRCLTI